MLTSLPKLAPALALTALLSAPSTAAAQPIARCQAGPVDAVLGSDGTVTIPPSLVDDGSSGASGRPVSLSVAPNMFSCSDIASNPHTVTLTVTGAGPTDTCTAQINVVPAPPTAVCANTTVTLDGAGNGSIVAADLDGGSTAGCGATVMFSASVTSFTCANLGGNNVTLTASAGGAMDTCSATVTVQDDAAPVLVCGATVTLPPSEDTLVMATLTDPGATDNCGVATITNDAPATGFPLGDTTVTFTGLDATGNAGMCSQTIRRDCCTPDMGVAMPDAGPPIQDAGTPTDAGTSADAGAMTDMGSGPSDMGSAATDMGSAATDMGATTDQAMADPDQGGTSGVDAGTASTSAGSSCAVAHAPSTGVPLWPLLALALLVRRRR